MDIARFKDVFLTEAQEILQRIESALVDLEKKPDDPKLQGLFRDFHTLKGNSATMKLDKLAQIAQAAESLLDVFAKAKRAPTPAALKAVRESLEPIRSLLQEFRDGRDRGLDAGPVVARLTAANPGAGRDAASS